MLFLDGVFTERTEGGLRFHPAKAPTAAELSELAHWRSCREPRSPTAWRLGRSRDARCLACRRCRSMRALPITKRVRSRAFPCMRAWLRGLISVTSWSDCAAISAVRRRLSHTPNGNVRYDVNGFTSVAGAGMRRSDPAEDALPR